MSKFAFVDVETTGLDAEKHGIWQIAMMIEIDGTLVHQQCWNVQPYRRDLMNTEALAKGHMTHETLETFPEPGQVKAEIEAVLDRFVKKRNKADKLHFVGYNSLAFDYPFLRHWWEKAGDPYFGSWFWHPSLDVMVLAGYYCAEVRHQLVNFKLHNVAQQIMGVPIDETQAHDAMYDIGITRDLFHHMRAPLIALWASPPEEVKA